MRRDTILVIAGVICLLVSVVLFVCYQRLKGI